MNELWDYGGIVSAHISTTMGLVRSILQQNIANATVWTYMGEVICSNVFGKNKQYHLLRHYTL